MRWCRDSRQKPIRQIPSLTERDQWNRRKNAHGVARLAWGPTRSPSRPSVPPLPSPSVSGLPRGQRWVDRSCLSQQVAAGERGPLSKMSCHADALLLGVAFMLQTSPFLLPSSTVPRDAEDLGSPRITSIASTRSRSPSILMDRRTVGSQRTSKPCLAAEPSMLGELRLEAKSEQEISKTHSRLLDQP